MNFDMCLICYKNEVKAAKEEPPKEEVKKESEAKGPMDTVSSRRHPHPLKMGCNGVREADGRQERRGGRITVKKTVH